MEQGYSLSNIFKNTTRKQRIAFGLAFLIIVVLLIVLILLAANNSLRGEGDEVGQANEQDEDVTEESYVNDQGYTVTKKTTTYENGETVTTETKMDQYGNVTTTDPDLITTYFPYQVMRRHTSEDLINSGFEYTLQYSLGLDEGGKVINATIEYCDEEGDKALVQQYLDSIPLDLSEYTVNYETFRADAFCE